MALRSEHAIGIQIALDDAHAIIFVSGSGLGPELATEGLHGT
jgi:hypothetical protein